MTGAIKEHWKILCEQAAVERDHTKLLELAREINRLLTEKQERLTKAERPREDMAS